MRLSPRGEAVWPALSHRPNPFDEAYIQPAAIKASGILSHRRLRREGERDWPQKSKFLPVMPLRTALIGATHRDGQSLPTAPRPSLPSLRPSIQLHCMGYKCQSSYSLTSTVKVFDNHPAKCFARASRGEAEHNMRLYSQT